MATNQDKVKELIDLRNQAKLGGGEKRIESQHKRVNIQPERIAMLLDEDSFEEFDMFVTHRCNNFGMEKTKFLGDRLLPDKERSTDVSYLYLHRILPYSEEHFQKCWLRRSAKSWTKR